MNESLQNLVISNGGIGEGEVELRGKEIELAPYPLTPSSLGGNRRTMVRATDLESASTKVEVFLPSSPIALIIENIFSFNPIFILSTEKVSKAVRKHSRGKSGRYSQFWAFLPVHKRLNWVLRQITSSIMFYSHKKFPDRLTASLLELAFTMESHSIYKNTLHVYNVVFKSYRQSLMRTYRRQQKKIEQQ